MSTNKNAHADFLYDAHYAKILGSRMHYVDVGQGDPILLLHGNPTSCYLWRNVIPHLQPLGRVIAVDLIGMGRSDKPDIDYRFVDHARYLDAFIEKLELRNLTLVLHDWGSALGFHYAARHPHNVRAIAFMEALVKSFSWRKDFSLAERLLFTAFRHPRIGAWLIQRRNFFVEQALPMFTARRLSTDEMDAYRAPFPDYASRKPVRVWPAEIPIEGQPQDVHRIVTEYRAWLERSPVPKLMLWAKPGAVMKAATVRELEAALPNLKSVCLGTGKHYVQEDHPHAIGKAIAKWWPTTAHRERRPTARARVNPASA